MAALRDASGRVPLTDLHLDYGGLLARSVGAGEVDWIKTWMANEPDANVRKVLSVQLGTYDQTVAGSGTSAPSSQAGPSRNELASFTKALQGDPRDEVPALEIRKALVRMDSFDRPRAMAAARAIDLRGAAHPFLIPVVRALVDFPNAGEFAAWLLAQGLIERPGPSTPAWIEGALNEGKRWITYEATESSHETLLYLGAKMTGSALASIEFEDLAPTDDRYAVAVGLFRRASPTDHDPAQVLAAYDGRNAHYAFAHPTSTLDTIAAMGLLNALLRARGSSLRLISVLTNGAVVVAGPEAGLRDAIRRKLLIAEPGPESADLIQRDREQLEKDLGL